MQSAAQDFDLSEKAFKKLAKNEQLAYLINAYNYYTIQLIISNYPTKSIKDLGSTFSSPWSKDFIQLFKKGDKISLDDIEHKMIRKNFDEPRIHFAVVCASIGCPPLRNEAFIASKIQDQLQDQAEQFLKDTTKNLIKGDELHLSKIFKWYGDDFNKTYGGYIPFVQKLLKTKYSDVEWLDYDWNLNDGTCSAK